MSALERIRAQALSLGFDTVGFTTPDLHENVQRGLQEYIEKGHHGDMQWMEDKAARRGDPKTLWPQARSVIMVGHNYAPAHNPLEKLAHKTIGNISCYAQGADYHDVIKKKLRVLAQWIAQEFSCEVKLFVDTAPVMEKSLAAQAGLGWQGKHTCLVSREFGSWLFLGSVFTTLELEKPSDPLYEPVAALHEDSRREVTTQPAIEMTGHCGSCTQCLDICPTQAFTGPGQLDARRCIAYLTNEHKGQIPLEFRKAIGNRIYGCDDCLAVCPWNKFAKESKENAYQAREALKAPLLRDLLQLNDAAFRILFSKSPIKRIGRDRFIRNVLVAAGNSEDPTLNDVISPLLHDASSLVSEMAAWALGELHKCAYIS